MELNPLDQRFAYLRTWDRDVLMSALEASGGLGNVGNAIPGTLVLRRHLINSGKSTTPFTLSECFETMCDLQRLACAVITPPAWRGARRLLLYYRRRLAIADLAYKSHGGTGECGCLWCRLWRMRIGEIEDALSEW